MTFANPLPWWALIGVLAAAGAAAWLAYRHAPVNRARRLTLAALRFVTLALLVFLLMRPIARTVPDGAMDAVVPILVDTSRSMSIEDAGGARRIDRARQMVSGALLSSLSARFQTEVFAFGESLTPMAAEQLVASGRRSDLTGALAAVAERYRGRPIAGIVVISDGGETNGPAIRAPNAPAPVYALGVGSTSIVRDREVLSVTAAEAVLDDSRVDLAVSAVSHGFGTAPIELRLLENGRPSEVRRVSPAGDGVPIREVFQVSPGRAAATVYTVEVPVASGELVPENNARSVLVQPPSRPRRVLLVQGAPGHEHGFLRRAWSSDPGLEVDTIVRQGRNEQGNDTFYIQAAPARSARLARGYPGRLEDLFAYDAVVLANLDGASLTTAQLQTTRAFVGRRGGGLLVLGAQAFVRQGLLDTPLEEVLPLDLADRSRGVLPAAAQPVRGVNRVTLTPAGESHPVMQLAHTPDETRTRWDAVPALAAVSAVGGPRAGATVLAVTGGPGGTQRPLVAVQRFGEGRSMVFTGEAAWRWRMLLPANDRSYDTFWRQAVRWLSLPASDPVALLVPAAAAPGESLELRVAARNAAFEAQRGAAVEIRVTTPDGRVETQPAAFEAERHGEGLFVARYRPDAPGVYRLTADVRQPGHPAAGTSTSMLVGGADVEMADPRLNARALQRIATASGGRLIDAGDIPALAEELHASVPAATLLVRRDLWHNAWWFSAILALLAGEWLVRRRSGLH